MAQVLKKHAFYVLSGFRSMSNSTGHHLYTRNGRPNFSESKVNLTILVSLFPLHQNVHHSLFPGCISLYGADVMFSLEDDHR